MILAFAQEFTVRISPCYPLAYPMCRERPWSSYTVQSVSMSTRPNRQSITTRTAPTLARVSHTCFSWCTQSIDLNVRPISLWPGKTKKNRPTKRRFIFNRQSFFCVFRLYGFKIHPQAYTIQQQAASNRAPPAVRARPASKSPMFT